jgi:hypothetical protein
VATFSGSRLTARLAGVAQAMAKPSSLTGQR